MKRLALALALLLVSSQAVSPGPVFKPVCQEREITVWMDTDASAGVDLVPASWYCTRYEYVPEGVDSYSPWEYKGVGERRNRRTK